MGIAGFLQGGSGDLPKVNAERAWFFGVMRPLHTLFLDFGALQSEDYIGSICELVAQCL
jgi:hypothetical protein